MPIFFFYDVIVLLLLTWPRTYVKLLDDCGCIKALWSIALVGCVQKKDDNKVVMMGFIYFFFSSFRFFSFFQTSLFIIPCLSFSLRCLRIVLLYFWFSVLFICHWLLLLPFAYFYFFVIVFVAVFLFNFAFIFPISVFVYLKSQILYICSICFYSLLF